MDNTWIKHTDINYLDEEILQFHFDTRDFHCFAIKEKHEVEIPLEKISKNPEYFYSGGEIKQLVEDLYDRSGGEGTWRYLAFEGNDCCGWECKYLRFYKTELGFVCITKEKRFKKKDFWKAEINKEVLGKH